MTISYVHTFLCREKVKQATGNRTEQSGEGFKPKRKKERIFLKKKKIKKKKIIKKK